MTRELIRVERDGSVATVTLNRAERGNALLPEMMLDLEQIAVSFREDSDTRVVVFSAAGDHFCFGVDLDPKNNAATGEAPLVLRRRIAEQGGRVIRAIREIHQPTICALQGVATGGGTCIATACDFRIGSDDCRIGFGEVKIGMNLMWNALPLCVQLVGPARAKQMVMTGKLFDAQTMADWGFLDQYVSRGQLKEQAEQWARAYAALPPIAVQMIKRSVNAISGALDASIMHMDADQWLLTSQTKDFAEGMAAFSAKRTPKFDGR